MSVILNIETATRICSVAISDNEKTIGIKESAVPNAHSSELTVFIQDLLIENSLSGKDIDAIAVSMGPGSYTGLRIGVAVAKGLCYTWGKPLIAINTLQSMADLFLQQEKEKLPGTDFLLCPMIDARRMEVYCAVFDGHGNMIKGTEAVILDESSFDKELSGNRIYFFGDGASKYKPLISHHKHAVFTEAFQASSKGLIRLSNSAFDQKNFSDPIYFEPYYLKDFVAKQPHSKF